MICPKIISYTCFLCMLALILYNEASYTKHALMYFPGEVYNFENCKHNCEADEGVSHGNHQHNNKIDSVLHGSHVPALHSSSFKSIDDDKNVKKMMSNYTSIPPDQLHDIEYTMSPSSATNNNMSITLLKNQQLFHSQMSTVGMKKRFDPEIKEIEVESAGTRVHKVLVKKISENSSSIYFEVDAFNLTANQFDNHDEYRWRIIEIDDKNIHKYLLEDEIKSSLRDSDGNTLAGPVCEKKNRCCLGSNTKGFNRRSKALKKGSHRSKSLWTWFVPAYNRPIFNFADSLDLIIDIFEAKKLQNRKEAHVVLIGDSIMEQNFSAFLCSLQRTLGSRVVSRYRYSYDTPDKIKLKTKLVGDCTIPNYEEQALVEINSTSKGKGIRRIKVTFIRANRPDFDDVIKRFNPAIIKTLCGIPFVAYTTNNSTKININPSPGKVDVIILNYGAHFKRRLDAKVAMASTIVALNDCKKRGVHVMFRDNFAQHFRFSYGGEYFEKSFGKQSGFDVPGSTLPAKTVSFCSPIVFSERWLINWRYQTLTSHFTVLDFDNQTLCNPKEEHRRRIDFIPAYATTAYYWNAHIFNDCTHYLYSPGLYLPIEDGIYKSLFKSTLKPGECKQLPDNSQSPFVSGPKGLSRGIQDAHDPSFLPQIDIVQMHHENATKNSKHLMAPITN